MKQYSDLFIDFDDTLYDTHGNAVIALQELFESLHLGDYFPEPALFYDEYWKANIDLWTRYSKGEITRDYLIVERFRRPLSFGQGLDPTEAYCLKASDLFLGYCSTKPGLVEGARELVDSHSQIRSQKRGDGLNELSESEGRSQITTTHNGRYQRIQRCLHQSISNTQQRE